MKICYALIPLAFSSTLANAALKYSLDGAAPTPLDLQTNEVQVGEISAESTLHVYDDETLIGGAPVNDLPHLVVRGTASAGGRLRVIICSGGVPTYEWFQLMRDDLDPGVVSLGGLSFAPPQNGDPNDTSLRDAAVVSIDVAGDITGDITAGRIFHIRAGDDTWSGTISGNITSTMPNDAVFDEDFGQFRMLFPSIGEIHAGHISGNITALPSSASGYYEVVPDPVTPYWDIYRTAAATQRTWSSIVNVKVGKYDLTTASTLTGNVVAERGTIGNIEVAGSIGTEVAPITVHAGVGLRHLATVTVNQNGQSVPLDAPIFANVTCGTKGPILKGQGLTDFSNVLVAPTSLQLLETDGYFSGNVILYDVWSESSGLDLAQRLDGRQGIFVGRDFTGTINVSYSYEGSDIIARNFYGSINIGQMLYGAIVAVGSEEMGATPTGGRIDSIVVGFGNFADAPRARAGGLLGPSKSIFRAPLTGFDADDLSERERWYHDEYTSTNQHNIDSAIVAYGSVGICQLAAMSNSLRQPDGSLLAYRPGLLRPRVESPYIQYLDVGTMEHGSVWSGRLAYDPSIGGQPLYPGQLLGYYASIDTCRIACVGPSADVWVDSTTDLQIADSMTGEIHLDLVASGQTIRIGAELNAFNNAIPTCFGGADPLSVNNYLYGYFDIALDSVLYFEPSPRVVWDAQLAAAINSTPTVGVVETNAITFDGLDRNRGTAEYGRILIREPDGLRGQIIIDANNTGAQRAATHWLGDVEIGTGESPDTGDPNLSVTPEVISTDEIRATTIGDGDGEGPRYTALPSDFGGGAVGLVPFIVHDRASWPPNPGPGQQPPQVLLEPVINDPDEPLPGERRTIDIEFYGPVRATGTGDPVLIYKAPLTDPTAFASQPVNAMFQVAVRRTGMGGDSSRLLVISRSPGQMIPKGVYKVVPIRDTTAASFLYCDGLDRLRRSRTSSTCSQSAAIVNPTESPMHTTSPMKRRKI